MIYTSYFYKVKSLIGLNSNLVFVSVAGKTPQWLEDSCIKIYKYPKLASKYCWWKVWKDKFKDNLESVESKEWYKKYYYETVLDKLNVNDVYLELMDISKRKDIVLLCYEEPHKFCHRHLIKEWLCFNGISCKEI